MENLHSKLESTHLKRVSDGVWASSDAAQFVLNAFRTQVQNGTLPMSEGLVPFYTFDPAKLQPAPEAAFKVGDWERYESYVLDVIRSSTGMDVTWEGPGTPIELRMTGCCQHECPGPILVGIISGPPPFPPSGYGGGCGGGKCVMGPMPGGFPGFALPPCALPQMPQMPPLSKPIQNQPPKTPLQTEKVQAAPAAKTRAPGEAHLTSLKIDGHFGLTASLSEATSTETLQQTATPPPSCAGAPTVSAKQSCAAAASNRPDNVKAEKVDPCAGDAKAGTPTKADQTPTSACPCPATDCPSDGK